MHLIVFCLVSELCCYPYCYFICCTHFCLMCFVTIKVFHCIRWSLLKMSPFLHPMHIPLHIYPVCLFQGTSFRSDFRCGVKYLAPDGVYLNVTAIVRIIVVHLVAGADLAMTIVAVLGASISEMKGVREFGTKDGLRDYMTKACPLGSINFVSFIQYHLLE